MVDYIEVGGDGFFHHENCRPPTEVRLFASTCAAATLASTSWRFATPSALRVRRCQRASTPTTEIAFGRLACRTSRTPPVVALVTPRTPNHPPRVTPGVCRYISLTQAHAVPPPVNIATTRAAVAPSDNQHGIPRGTLRLGSATRDDSSSSYRYSEIPCGGCAYARIDRRGSTARGRPCGATLSFISRDRACMSAAFDGLQRDAASSSQLIARNAIAVTTSGARRSMREILAGAALCDRPQPYYHRQALGTISSTASPSADHVGWMRAVPVCAGRRPRRPAIAAPGSVPTLPATQKSVRTGERRHSP